MHWHHRTECPDCKESLTEIKIIDATAQALEAGISHVDLSFASPLAGKSSYTKTIPIAGTVKAKLCAGCGRIYLYAVTSSGGLPRV